MCAKCHTGVTAVFSNSLWPSEVMWWHRSGSTLAQVMACCLTAPIHYLKQCWLIISTDQWCLCKGNFTRDIPAINHENQLQFAKIKFLSNLPGTNELSHHCTIDGYVCINWPLTCRRFAPVYPELPHISLPDPQPSHVTYYGWPWPLTARTSGTLSVPAAPPVCK